MLGERILQALILVASFTGWDFCVKDFYYSWVTQEGQKVGLLEVAGGYGLVFLFAFLLSHFLTRSLGLDETKGDRVET